MNIQDIKSFSNELRKIAGIGKIIGGVIGGGFAGLSVLGAHNAGKQSAMKLGRGNAPLPIQPSQNILRKNPLDKGIGTSENIGSF
jgi:hypothetical protein